MANALARKSDDEFDPSRIASLAETLRHEPSSPGRDALLQLTTEPDQLKSFLLTRSGLTPAGGGHRNARNSGHCSTILWVGVIALLASVLIPSLNRARYAANEYKYEILQKKDEASRSDNDKTFMKEFEKEKAERATDEQYKKDHPFHEIGVIGGVIGSVAAAIALVIYLSTPGTDTDKDYKKNLKTLIDALNEEQKQGKKLPEPIPSFLSNSISNPFHKDSLFYNFIAYKLETEGAAGVQSFMDRLSTLLVKKRQEFVERNPFSREWERTPHALMSDTDFVKALLTPDEKQILDKLSTTKHNPMPLGEALDNPAKRIMTYKPAKRWAAAGVTAFTIGAGTLAYRAMPDVRPDTPSPTTMNADADIAPKLVADKEPAWFTLAGALLAAGGAGVLIGKYPAWKKGTDEFAFGEILRTFSSSMSTLFEKYEKKKSADRQV